MRTPVPEGRRGCPVCGQSLRAGQQCPNRWCARPDRGFSVVFPVGSFDGALRHAILRYKYRGERWWAGRFAESIATYLREHSTWFEEFHLLVPAPSYTGPGARRSWDPVGVVAERLQPLIGPEWEVGSGAIVKRHETPSMQGSGWAGRQAIAAGPLRCSLVVTAVDQVAGARILVLDDVLTEGSTLREVARALRSAGAREVAGLVLARRPWRDVPPA